MFTNLITKRSKLDRAIILSVAAMLSFNIVVLANQFQSAPQLVQSSGAAAQQA